MTKNADEIIADDNCRSFKGYVSYLHITLCVGASSEGINIMFIGDIQDKHGAGSTAGAGAVSGGTGRAGAGECGGFGGHEHGVEPEASAGGEDKDSLHAADSSGKYSQTSSYRSFKYEAFGP